LLPQVYEAPGRSSIIMILATDAPMSSRQLHRLARRATLGLARTGSTAHNSSGDIAIAFSTAQAVPFPGGDQIVTVKMLSLARLDPLFDAAAEATEEAIVNSLTMARSMTGLNGNTVHALPLDRLLDILARYRRLPR
jgi:D-aminopeptidase